MKASWGHNTNWKSRNDLLWLLLVWLLLPAVAEAARVGLEVRLTSAKLQQTEPGKVVTASFLVSNTSDRDEEYVESVLLPAGWQKIAPIDVPFTVPAGKQRVRVLALVVPATAASGRFEIGYKVASRRDYDLIDTAGFEVRVLPVCKLELVVDDKPPVVIAGEQYEIGLRLINRGNTPTAIRLETKSSPEFPVTGDTGDLVLDPAGSRKLRLRVQTDAALKHKLLHVLVVKALATEGDAVAKQSVGVDVIPVVTGDRDPYVRLPSQLRFIAVKDSGQAEGFQGEFSGAGALDEAGKHRVDFLFRGPDIQTNSVFGLHEEYRLSYFQDKFDAHLGDRNYFLSPLLERNAYGRGAELNVHPGPFGAGAFYLQSRFQQPDFQELGTYVKKDLTDWLGVKANFLRRWGSGHPTLTNGVPQSIYSAESFLKFDPAAQVHLEYGLSNTDDGQTDHGVHAEIRGELFGKLDYALEKIHAGPQFFGYYNDVDSTSAALTFPIYQKLRGSFSFQQYDNNLDRNPIKSTIANRETLYRPGLRYTFAFGTDVTLEYTMLSRRDALLPADFDFDERSFRLGLGHSFNKVGAQVFIERGQLEDRLTGQTNSGLERYSLYAYYRPTPRQSYSAFFTTGHGSFDATPSRTRSYGGNATWQLRDDLWLSVQGARNSSDTGTAGHSDTVDATLRYTLPNRHQISVTGRWTYDSGAGNEESAALITYTIPIGIPVGKKQSVGALRGRVYDADDRPVSRAVLTTGNATAVTDRNGEFIFPALPPGEHLLRLEQHSLGEQSVTTEPLPLPVEVKPAANTVVNIGVVSPARVTVQVRGAAEVLVELHNDREVLRDFTDRHGEVSFENVRPGHWTMKVPDDGLPAHHYIDNPVRELDLQPGQQKELVVNVLPRHRPIEFIDQGAVSSAVK
jgi:uncharacterized protein (DUF2141 family)